MGRSALPVELVFAGSDSPRHSAAVFYLTCDIDAVWAWAHCPSVKYQRDLGDKQEILNEENEVYQGVPVPWKLRL